MKCHFRNLLPLFCVTEGNVSSKMMFIKGGKAWMLGSVCRLLFIYEISVLSIILA